MDAITRMGELDKFFGRKPAWHRKGYVADIDISATDALARIGGAPTVTVEELLTFGGHVIEQRAIMRSPFADDANTRCFGVVGPEYTPITPQEAVQLWDEYVALPVETLGMLGQYGEELFMTTRLPGFGVRGEEVDNYLLGHFPLVPNKCAQAIVSPVMVVCQNTLRMAESAATQKLRAVHDRTVKARIAMWLADIVVRAEQQTDALREAFDALAAHRIDSAQRDDVLSHTYPYPRKPDGEWKDNDQWRTYDYKLDAADRAREDVIVLFDGAMTGANLEARKGTAWGLFGAVSERENYRRGGDDASSAASILLSSASSSRGATMQRAYSSLLRTIR